MAVHKKESFTPEQQEMALIAKALSHPARIAILSVLATRNECICGEIVEVMPLAQSTVSQHLKELLEAGLIKGSVDGPRSCYCINWEVFGAFKDSIEQWFSSIQHQQKQTCC